MTNHLAENFCAKKGNRIRLTKIDNKQWGRWLHRLVSSLQNHLSTNATQFCLTTNEAIALEWALESVMGWKVGLVAETWVVVGFVPVSLAKARGRRTST
jgi:hypothetical protein